MYYEAVSYTHLDVYKRQSNLYLLDKTVAAEQVDEDHWTVTVTFWADFEGRELQGDGYFHTVSTTGYSTAVLDYACLLYTSRCV